VLQENVPNLQGTNEHTTPAKSGFCKTTPAKAPPSSAKREELESHRLSAICKAKDEQIKHLQQIITGRVCRSAHQLDV
jgi:hypothetical protein